MAGITADSGQPGYIVSPSYDYIFFLMPPLVALAIGIVISGTPFTDAEFEFWDQDVTWSGLLIGIVIHAHIFAVVFRSHGNSEIFRQFPMRFVAAPIALYLAMAFSEWAIIIVAVVATFWDVYHSGAQTFGFGRIYDSRAGNDALQGRRLDATLNQLLYAGPILAGATMMAHFESFEDFEDVGATFFTAVPAHMEGSQGAIATAILSAGAVFLIYYIYQNWRLSREGYRVSPMKIFLYASTGACSIYTWGFNTWGEAFFIMNLFHAVQYFGIVWFSEKKRMLSLFGLRDSKWGRAVCISIFLGSAALYGYGVEAADTGIRWLWAITLTVSIMHFWYDGFIWSVRKKQV